MLIVTRESLAEVCARLSHADRRGLDTETDGTGQANRLFAITITVNENESYYFNFNPNAPDRSQVLDRADTVAGLTPVFGNRDSQWDLSNAKFDLRMFAKEGLEIAGTVHCTEAIERIIYNAHLKYGIDACAQRRGLKKSEAVKEYIKEHGLSTVTKVPGKKKKVTVPHFDQVPFDVMAPYASRDSYLSTTVARDQDRQIAEMSADPRFPPISFIAENEKRLTKTLARVEGYGVRLDRHQTQKALDYELGRAAAGRMAFQTATGEEFVNSGKALAKIFDQFGVPYPRTDKGNPSFKGDWLDELPDTTPLGRLINNIRRPEKRASTYYSSYLAFATPENRIHCDIRQGGTESGRLSARDPNLTNPPKEDEPEDMDIPFHVRECFLPDEGMFFLDIDWKAIQYRIMVDMAGEMKLLRAIMAGEDVHEATARLCGITRKQAKTLNFALLFGAGPKKVALMLGISIRDAQALVNLYFARLPNIEAFVKEVPKKARARGFVFNPYGRRCHLAYADYAYALTCHVIQGTEGDTLKIAMNQIDELFQAKKARSRMAIPVHDQILFNWHPNELELVQPVVDIMESVYDKFAFNGMKLLTSVEHSTTRWGKRHLKPGLPDGLLQAS